MIDQPTPETAAKLADDPHPPSGSPDYARALEIHIHLLRAELADERARKSDALIAAVDDIERLTANNQELKELLFALARAIHDENWKEIGNLVPRMNAAFATPAQ